MIIRFTLITLWGALGFSFTSTTLAQSSARTEKSVNASPAAVRETVLSSPYRAASLSARAREFYQLIWGVDSLAAKAAESGQMIRFSYRVLDPLKAQALNDKKSAPLLIDETAHVKLVVPTMEKVGQLRQSSSPEAGKSYWMVFSNKGGLVKPGDRVSVVIGKFRVDGLVVQ